MGRILLVDPSLLDRQRMRIALEAAGHTVMEAAGPGEALRVLRELPRGSVRLVVTELHFPDGDGAALVGELKADPVLRELPVLLVTPQPSRERVIELIIAGVSMIVVKPFSGELLLRRVTETLAELAHLAQGEGEVVSWTVTEYLRREVKRTERSRSQLTVMVVEVASGNHEQIVDLVIRSAIRRLRESDLVVRLGPTQIAIILPDTDAAGAAVAESRVQAIGEDLASEHTGGIAPAVDLRVGAAVYPTEAGDAQTLLSLARERVHPLHTLS